MATVVRRYRRTVSVLALDLGRLLPVGAFVSTSEPEPGEQVDISVDNTVANYAADLDDIMAGRGFAFVGPENPPTTLEAAAAADVPPATRLRESGGTELALGAIADGQSVVRSGLTLAGAAAGSSFDLRDVFVFDHFLSGNADLDELGLMGWRTYVTGTAAGVTLTGEAGCPGIVILSAGTAAAARAGIALGEATVGGKVVLGGPAPISLEFLVKYAAAADLSALNLESSMYGFGLDWAADTELGDGLYIRFAPAAPALDTTFKLVAIAGGVSTVLASTVAPAAGTWYRVRIVYTPGTGLATFEIDGAAVAGSISTNIPAIGLGVGMKARSVGSGTNATVRFCYILGMQDIN